MAQIYQFPKRNVENNMNVINGNNAIKNNNIVDYKQNNVILREKLLRFLESLNGKFVSIDFHKKSGSIRTLNGRMGVRKHVKGIRWSINDRMDLPYVCIYEVSKPGTGIAGGYRNVDISGILSIRANGTEYEIF